MKMIAKVDIETLFQYIYGNDFDTFQYHKLSKDYYRKHGYGARIDAPRNDLEKGIANAYRMMHESDLAAQAIIDVFGMDMETCNRLAIAYRACRRWYKETNWCRMMPDKMKKQIANFIFKDDGYVVEKRWYDGEYVKA